MFFPPMLLPVASIGGASSSSGKRRYFTTLTPALSQYLDIPAWKPSTSFTISRSFATTATSDSFLSGTLGSEDCINLDVYADKVRASCYVGATLQGVVLEGVASAHNDGKLRNATITWDDATNIAELFIDGVSIGTKTWLIDGNQDIKYIGKRGTSYGSNTIGEIKLTDGVDDRWYKVNEDWVENDILVNHAAVLGAESWNDAPTSIDTGWTDNADGSYSCDGTGNVLVTDDANVIADDDLILVSFTVSGYVSGDGRLLMYGSSKVAIGATIRANGDYTALLLVTSATGSGTPTGKAIVQSLSVGFVGTFSNISIRKAPGYGTAVNITDADAEVFTEHKEVTPNEWRNADSSVIIPIAGT